MNTLDNRRGLITHKLLYKFITVSNMTFKGICGFHRFSMNCKSSLLSLAVKMALFEYVHKKEASGQQLLDPLRKLVQSLLKN